MKIKLHGRSRSSSAHKYRRMPVLGEDAAPTGKNGKSKERLVLLCKRVCFPEGERLVGEKQIV